jgi:hypothetical protein
MKLYRLEESLKSTSKKPWEWRACQLDGYRWREVCGGKVKELHDNWLGNMYERAALQLGAETESVKGFLCTYFIVREPWPERVIEDLVAKVDGLESEIRDLRMDIEIHKGND